MSARTLTAGAEQLLDGALTRRRLAPNVIALWPEDRPPVVNKRGRGSLPRVVEKLRFWDRFRPGVYCRLSSGCQPENNDIVVQLLRRTSVSGRNDYWEVRAVTRPLVIGGIKSRVAEPGLHWEAFALEETLRRCAAPSRQQLAKLPKGGAE